MTAHKPITKAASVPQKRGRKYDDVIAGARTVFLRDGFDGAGVDDIAREAGVSKATLYSYFPDKRFLFLEVAQLECAALADRAKDEVDLDAPPEIVLPIAAAKIIGFINSRVGLGIFRLCVAESERFPELGQLYYHSGPMTARGKLATYLACCAEKGSLAITDPSLAADQFCELCRTDAHTRLLFGVSGPPSDDEVAQIIRNALDMFMARYKV
jgi:TetR/AcrR family transcriptional repressor of mexJK operon